MVEPSERNCHHIVLIDDDEAIRDSLELVLGDKGYSVESYEDGAVAIEGLKSGSKACLILLDMMMPVMNGWEFLAAIAKVPHLAAVPVVAVTASGMPIDEKAVVQILRKPFNLQDLFNICDFHCPHSATPK